MDYNEYGAIVYKNGERRADFEDRAFMVKGNRGRAHGIIQDEHMMIVCYQDKIPFMYYDGNLLSFTECGIRHIDTRNFEPFDIEYKGYTIHFESGFERDNSYSVDMYTPSGDHWVCEYDYHFGDAFEYAE